LVDQRSVHWQNRAHFFVIAARLMRRIVLKTRVAARRRSAAVVSPLCLSTTR
jgi:hypothetical protein